MSRGRVVPLCFRFCRVLLKVPLPSFAVRVAGFGMAKARRDGRQYGGENGASMSRQGDGVLGSHGFAVGFQ